MSPLTFVQILLSVSLNAMAQIFLRNTMVAMRARHGQPSILIFLSHLLLQPFFLAGMLCYAISILIWLSVLSKVEMSAAYPFLSIGFVIAAVVGFFFGEHVTLVRVMESF